MGSSSAGVTKISDIAPVSSKEFLDIRAVTEYRFTLIAYLTCQKHRKPWALLWSNDLIIFTILSTKTILLLDIRVHCLVKNLLNRFAFSKKNQLQVCYLLTVGLNGILLPFTNAFKIVQYVLGAVLVSLSLFARRPCFFKFGRAYSIWYI